MSTARAAAPPDPPRRRGRPRKPPDQRKPERHPSGPSSKRTASPEQTARVVGLVRRLAELVPPATDAARVAAHRDGPRWRAAAQGAALLGVEVSAARLNDLARRGTSAEGEALLARLEAAVSRSASPS